MLFLRSILNNISPLHIESTDIKIDAFAKSLNLRRTTFYRKLKSIVGLSPIEFVFEMRMKRAIQLIELNEYSFTEIAYKIGFNEPAYFSRSFKKYTGMTPSEYKQRL